MTNYNNMQPYPNNLLRNVARAAVGTPFVLVLDVDMVPWPSSLASDFERLAFEGRVDAGPRRAFVVPAFEMKATPGAHQRHATERKLGVDTVAPQYNKTIQPFYFALCWKCQRHTLYDQWLKSARPRSTRSLHHAPRLTADVLRDYDATYAAVWHDPWEPFYIAPTATLPRFDERFKQYGFNRISQVCEMHIAGFEFEVLRTGFVLHAGWKQQGTAPLSPSVTPCAPTFFCSMR